MPINGVTFHGGPGNDSLELVGGDFVSIENTLINSSDGTIDFDGSVVNYTGLEPVLEASARYPLAVLSPPVVLAPSAAAPLAVLALPVVLFRSASAPTAVLFFPE